MHNNNDFVRREKLKYIAQALESWFCDYRNKTLAAILIRFDSSLGWHVIAHQRVKRWVARHHFMKYLTTMTLKFPHLDCLYAPLSRYITLRRLKHPKHRIVKSFHSISCSITIKEQRAEFSFHQPRMSHLYTDRLLCATSAFLDKNHACLQLLRFHLDCSWTGLLQTKGSI